MRCFMVCSTLESQAHSQHQRFGLRVGAVVVASSQPTVLLTVYPGKVIHFRIEASVLGEGE